MIKGIDTLKNETVAVKKMSKKGLSSVALEFYSIEVMIGKLLNEESHPGIVRQLAYIESFSELIIVMEYIEGVNIF